MSPVELASPPAHPEADRRTRRLLETRRRILVAALELFAERGDDSVTVEEIAERADVARATVFNHFTTKEQLCTHLGELQLELLRAAIDDGRVSGSTAAERIGSALQTLAGFPGLSAEQYRSILVKVLANCAAGELPEHRRQIFGILQGYVEEGQRSGELRADVPAMEIVGFLVGIQFQATLWWAYGQDAPSLSECLSRTLRLAFEGLSLVRGTGEEVTATGGIA
jgi:AcrR family transcriptional regulator